MPLLRLSLLALSLLLAAACSNQPPRDASGRPLRLETVHRPFGPTTYGYRSADEANPVTR